MKASTLSTTIVVILLTCMNYVSTQDCFHGEDGYCCLCSANWQCGLSGLYCPKTTTDFNINIYLTTTERIIVSGNSGLSVFLILGIILGLVMALLMCFVCAFIPGLRNYFVRLYVTVATQYYRTRLPAEDTHHSDVELGDLPTSQLAYDSDLE